MEYKFGAASFSANKEYILFSYNVKNVSGELVNNVSFSYAANTNIKTNIFTGVQAFEGHESRIV